MEQSVYLSLQEIDPLEMWSNLQGIQKQLPWETRLQINVLKATNYQNSPKEES